MLVWLTVDNYQATHKDPKWQVFYHESGDKDYATTYVYDKQWVGTVSGRRRPRTTIDRVKNAKYLPLVLVC